MEKTKPNTTKACIYRSEEVYYNKINTKKLKPGLVAFYDIRPGNGPTLKGREEISKEKVKKKD